MPIITTEFKPFGVQLTFVPTVLAGGIINLRLAPSVSELDFAQAIQISGFLIPSLTKREARTTIELRDGQSFAIAGLLQARNRRDISQLPWIGSVPVLGALFRSAAYQQLETDLVVIVTPHLVAPSVPGQRLASPLDNTMPTNDVDFFLMGEMEEKKRYRNYVTSGGDIQGPYGHMIRGALCLRSRRPDLGQELRHMYHENQMHHRSGHVCSQPHLLGRLGLGLGPVSWHAISRAKRYHRLRRRRRARCERRYPHHRSVAALCRQPADSSATGSGWRGRSNAIARTRRGICPVRLRRYLMSRQRHSWPDGEGLRHQ